MSTRSMSVGFNLTQLDENTNIKVFDSTVLVKGGLARFQPGMNFSGILVVNDETFAGWTHGYTKTYYTIKKGSSDDGGVNIELLPIKAVESEERRQSAYVEGEISENELEAAVVLSELA